MATQLWCTVSGGGFWGWTVTLCVTHRSGQLLPLDVGAGHAWTRAGAERKAARMIRRYRRQLDRKATSFKIAETDLLRKRFLEQQGQPPKVIG
jgi:hypothetical protein